MTSPRITTSPGSVLSAAQHIMLDAAEEVIIRDGIGHLTIDAVARQAKLSKSGLLHHYPSKDALIDALVDRQLAGWRADYEEAIANQPPGPGRVPRAFLHLCLSESGKCTNAVHRSSIVLVAALVHDAARVEPLRAMRNDVARRLKRDGLSEGVGDAVLLAVDGLWFNRIFGLSDLTPQKLAAVRSALLQLVERAELEAPGARPGSKPRSRKQPNLPAAAAQTFTTKHQPRLSKPRTGGTHTIKKKPA